jgi:acetoin utilization protein AcuB
MRIYEIMTSSVETVSAGESAERAWESMRSRRIHHLVVLQGREVAGIVSDRDLGGTRGSALRRGKTVQEFMTPEVVSVGSTATLKQAANLMRGRSLGCLPVIDGGRLKGIITVSDLLELIGRGAERPVAKARRWTLKHRGQRPKRAFIG